MNPKYKFLIRKGSQSATATEIHPVWKDDLSMEYAKESQQQFFRANLSGSIDLQRDDYTYVMSEAFGTVFYLEIQISDNGASWSHYWWGKFTLTDCKVNVDDHILTVKPEVVDQYTDILAGMEKEFDLIKLAPAINQIQLHKRPCIQIFNRASETVTCICGNQSWEQEASLPEDNQGEFLVEHCHFYHPTNATVEISIPDPPLGYESAFASPFRGQLSPQGSILTNQQDVFYIEYWVQVVGGFYDHGLRIKHRTQGDVRWSWEQIGMPVLEPLPLHFVFEAQTSQTVNMDAYTTDMGLYSRVVLNKDTYDGSPSLPLYSDDILPYNRNYKYAVPYDASSMIVVSQSTDVQADPTEWGKRESDGMYYLPPGTPYDKYIPIGKNLWGEVSTWIQKTSDYQDIETDGTYDFFLNDAYPLWSCISVLLGEIAPSITFAGTSQYSVFLYSGYDPIQGRDNTLYLTPKSNITNREYQTPAQKAPVTLKDILTMLKNVYKCYWFIDTNNRLRIEHISWFMNGGSYNGSPIVGINLTTMLNKRNGKPWAFGVNSYEYEKPDMPERYQFGWMDEVTEEFKGQPIEVRSSFVQQGKVEEITVANFTSDFDYMMLNPGAISPDGFALLNVLDAGSYLYVPVITFYTGTYNWRAQNGWLSFHRLQWDYWRYDMPAYAITIEGDTTAQAASVQKGKKQQVSIPLGLTDPNTMQLVATGLGNGQIQHVSIRLTSRMAKTQLRYDTE